MAGDPAIPPHFQDWNVSKPSVKPSVVKMEKSARVKSLAKKPWCIAIFVAVTIAILIAIIVPLAILLPKRGKAHQATLILPLYIYPKSNATWSPLYNALSIHPDLKVLVVVNPSSGPGKSQFPDEQYSAGLKQLSLFPNVQMVGYVRTGYASRNLTDVLAEVSTYAGWASGKNSVAMQGIFFDESPHQHTEEAVSFMRSASKAVKDAEGLVGQRTVIRNPGVIPDARFNDPNTDIIVVFEQAYSSYQATQDSLGKLAKDGSEYSYMVHSVPPMQKSELRTFVDDLSKRAKYLFVTTNDEDYYESFGSDWADFTDVVPT